jgi:hypothetical protein
MASSKIFKLPEPFITTTEKQHVSSTSYSLNLAYTYGTKTRSTLYFFMKGPNPIQEKFRFCAPYQSVQDPTVYDYAALAVACVSYGQCFGARFTESGFGSSFSPNPCRNPDPDFVTTIKSRKNFGMKNVIFLFADLYDGS